MDFDKLKELARTGYLPHKITKVEKVTCTVYQIGKSHLTPADKGSSVIKCEIINPEGLICMDQAESSTPGRTLTNSGKNNENKVFIITLFVDSISKK